MARPKEPVFKIVISDPKTGKTVQIESKDIDAWLNKKIGDVVDGSVVGLDGYKLEITGGSDFSGAPMVKHVEGPVKKYIWWRVNKRVRVKKLVRGNTISQEIVQINTKIVEYGNKSFEDIYNEWKSSKEQSNQ